MITFRLRGWRQVVVVIVIVLLGLLITRVLGWQ
jgi:hypothetical protein